MTGHQEEERPYEEPENPVEELMEVFEKTRWRPAKAPWGEAERWMREKEERREELMKAWRRRHVGPLPDAPRDPGA